MFYNFTIIASANTTEATAEETTLLLCKGVIVHAECYFTEKCQGQVRLAIRDALHQVWPTNPDEWMRGEKQAVPFERYHEITGPPYMFTATVWNSDDTYAHTVVLRFIVVRPIQDTWSELAMLHNMRQLLGWGQPGIMERL